MNAVVTGAWSCRTIGLYQGETRGVDFSWRFDADGHSTMDLGSRVADAVNSGAMSRELLQYLNLNIFLRYVTPTGTGGGDYYEQAQDMVDYPWKGVGTSLVMSQWAADGYDSYVLLQATPLNDGSGGILLANDFRVPFVCYPA